MQKAKKEMKNYLKDVQAATDNKMDNNLYDDIKLEVCKRMHTMLNDLGKIMEFCIDESNLGGFDDLLDSKRIEDIQI
jgi:hypothetical protein